MEAQAGETSTAVSLEQAPSARSARASAETKALMVWPVGLVASQAPFSDATTPGGTASVILSGRITAPRSFHTRTGFLPESPRARASSGCIKSGGASPDLPPRPSKVEEMRLADD